MSSKADLVIESIRKGNNDVALKYLYKDPLRKIRKFILTNSGTLEDADDVFQEAVLVLFHYIRSGKYNDNYDLDGFLFRVAKNFWIDMARKKKNLIKEEFIGFDYADDSDLLVDMINEERMQTFHTLFNKLGDNCKSILTYFFFEKKSLKEITVLMGFKDENVAKNQQYRCKKYFSQIISENEGALKILRV